jgi:hypothetical protein
VNRCYYGDQIKEDAKGGARSKNEADEKCTQHFNIILNFFDNGNNTALYLENLMGEVHL